MDRFKYPVRVHSIGTVKKYPVRVDLGFLAYATKFTDPIGNDEVRL